MTIEKAARDLWVSELTLLFDKKAIMEESDNNTTAEIYDRIMFHLVDLLGHEYGSDDTCEMICEAWEARRYH